MLLALVTEVVIQHIVGCGKGCLHVGEYAVLLLVEQFADALIVVEVVAQLLIDGFIHPILGLLLTLVLEVAILAHEVEVFIYHIPHLGDTQFVVARVGEHLG